MAVEEKRGCGYRKIGGTYLESDAGGFECGRLPVPLLPCPLCDQRPRFTRGMSRISPRNILHAAPVCAFAEVLVPGGEGATSARCAVCPFDRAFSQEQVGLMWVGGKFYTPSEFTDEAGRLGVSKRIGSVPKWFKVGMWVFLAHEQTISKDCDQCGGSGMVHTAEKIVMETVFHPGQDPKLLDPCETCAGSGTVYTPAVFHAFQPKRVVRIVPDTMPEAERDVLHEQGLTLIEVPHDDPDHQPGKRRDEEE